MKFRIGEYHEFEIADELLAPISDEELAALKADFVRGAWVDDDVLVLRRAVARIDDLKKRLDGQH